MKIIILLTIIYLVPLIYSYGNCPHYQYKKHEDRSNLISKLPDSHQLNNTALVGTVYSLAIIKNGKWNLGETQELSLADQMKSGVRVIEINALASSFNNELLVYSRPQYFSTTFAKVLEEINQFLNVNPREFIILYVHQQTDFSSSGKRNCQLIDQYKKSSTGSRLVTNWKFNDTIKDLRGKILLATSSMTFDKCAVNLYSNCKIQETKVSNYISFSPQQAKWYAVQSLQFESFKLKKMCFVNYVIDYADVFAPLYSKTSFPNRDNKCEVPLNYRMAEYFENPHRALIIVMAADITQELIDRVIGSNFVN